MNESNTRLPSGLWPVMLTPFKEDNSIDFNALQTLTEYYISNGATGLFTNCLSSEMYQLTPTERIALTKAVVDFTKGRMPVLSTGSFSKDPDENSEFIKKIADQGVDTVVLVSSILIEKEESEGDLKRKIEKIMDATGSIRLGMYECPIPYKRCVSPETLKWLADTGRFIFHKDTTCREDLIREKIAAVKGTPLQVYNAHTPDALQSLKDGAYGLCPISANFFPELYAYFFRLFHLGDFEQMKKLSEKMIEIDVIVHQHYYPWTAKIFLKKRGLDIPGKTRVAANGRATIDQHQLKCLFEKVQKTFADFDIKGIGIV